MKYATMIALLVLTLTMAGIAQLGTLETISANVPFEFVAWDKTIPAGNCIVERATMNTPTLAIRNVAAKTAMLTMVVPDREVAPTGNYSLVFNRYGSRHFLRKIKTPDGRVYKLAEGKLEREVLAQNIAPQEEILLALAN